MSSPPQVPPSLLRGRPLKNVTCPYCAAALDLKTRTKEHVIGRRFVPKGSTENRWNLVLWACSACNNNKSDLEDDIAAITMYFHTTGLASTEDQIARAEAIRRGPKSSSRLTGKSVAESHVALNSTSQLGPAEMTFRFVAPPQIDDTRAYELARLQMLGFFYLLTYEPDRNLGHWWPGAFMPLHGTIRTDWGNVVQRAFMKAVTQWDHRLIVHTADDYYKAAIRRHPSEELWSWAVEWNKSFRLVGFFGNSAAAKAIAQTFPQMQLRSIRESSNSFLRFREEEALPENEDVLFQMPSEETD
jgi:hypothetical protein